MGPPPDQVNPEQVMQIVPYNADPEGQVMQSPRVGLQVAHPEQLVQEETKPPNDHVLVGQGSQTTVPFGRVLR